MKWRWLILFALFFALGSGVICALIFVALSNLPAVESLQDYHPSGVTRIFDYRGKLFAEIAHERRTPIALEQIPTDLKHAVIAIEDAHFFKHPGISVRGIARAFFKNLRHGRFAEGGSTLTQQLTKVLFLSPDKSLIRKFKEMILAFQIEKSYSKEEILELYLNQIYMGEGNYGAVAAANYYFCKPLADLSLAEIATLAAIPKGPGIYAPTKNVEQSRRRRNLVLSAMQAQGYIDSLRMEQARAEPVQVLICPSPGLRNHASALMLAELQEALGENLTLKGKLQVASTLDTDLQQAAESALATGLDLYRSRHSNTKALPAAVHPQGAVVVLDAKSGGIRAMVGSSDFRSSQFNRATQAYRQAGSAFKPLIYAMAMDSNYTQSSLMQDAPLTYVGVPGGAAYNPDNYSKTFMGPVTIRVALELSLNSVPLQLASRLGVGSIQSFLKLAGITSPQPDNLTVALGSGSVTPLELTKVYTNFFNDGVYSTPHAIDRVTSPAGEIILQKPVLSTVSMKPGVARIIKNILRGAVTHGTAQALKALPCQAAGKTGTSDDNRDAWFIGGINSLVIGVWVGYDDNHSLGKQETGAVAAVPIWQVLGQQICTAPGVMGTADSANDNATITKMIDRSSGRLATARCEDKVEAVYLTGTEPKELCTEEL